MGTLMSSLRTLPLSVWYDAAGILLGIIFGIVAILRRRLRRVGAGLLIITVGSAIYLTYHDSVAAVLVVWTPAYVGLLIGFLLVARGYHKKAWEKEMAVSPPALPAPTEKPQRAKGKAIDLHILDRVRRNLAGEDLRTTVALPEANPTGIPEPPEPALVPSVPVTPLTAPLVEDETLPRIAETDAVLAPGIRYDAMTDVLEISFGGRNGTYTQGVSDPDGRLIPDLHTIHDRQDDGVIGVQVQHLSRMLPQPSLFTGAVDGLRGLFPQGPRQWSERTLSFQVAELATQFLRPGQVDGPLGQNREALAALAQSIVNYLGDTAPEHLETVPVAPLAPVDSAAPDSVAVTNSDSEEPDRPVGEGSSEQETMSETPSVDEAATPHEGAAAADVEPTVEAVVSQAIGSLRDRLGDALGAFGQELTVGLTAATKGGE